jgi:uncharacterized protein (DUF2164 family)
LQRREPVAAAPVNGNIMTIKLQKETHDRLLGSIKRYFAENTESEIGDLKAAMLLEFCVKEIGPSVYNQAIADAQAYFQDRAAELPGLRYEAEFDYWKR